MSSKIENAIAQMEYWANDNSHGYDQRYRWGEKGDYDCSSAVITAWELAGVPVKSKGATYTGNMYNVFISCGFKNVTSSISLSTGAGLKRGDVLLNVANHTAMYCGNGKEVEASINENGTITGGTPGDQTGREFLIRSYRNFPWDYVLRYQESISNNANSGGNTAMNNAQIIYNILRNSGVTHAGACGILGNLEAESALSSTNLENYYEGRLGYNDSSYTSAVDNGSYTNFVRDSAGYGLAQWTYWSRKQGLLNYAKSQNRSIGDLEMQVGYLVKELKSDFASVWRVVTTTDSVQEASSAVLLNFERPANANGQINYRYNLSMKYNNLTVTNEKASTSFNTHTNTSTHVIKKVPVQLPELSYGSNTAAVRSLQILLNSNNYNCGTPDGDFGSNTLNAVKTFQRAKGLTVDGIVGQNTWAVLIC